MTSIRIKSTILAWVVKSSVIWTWANSPDSYCFTPVPLYSSYPGLLPISRETQVCSTKDFEVVVVSVWHIISLLLCGCLFLVTQISSQMQSPQMAFFHHNLKGACITARCFSLICQSSSLLCSPVIKTVLGIEKAFNKYLWIKEWVISNRIKLHLIMLNSSSSINVRMYMITKFCWFKLLNKSKFTFFFQFKISRS